MPISAGAAILAGSLGAAGIGGGSNFLGSILSYKQQKKLIDKQAKTNYNYSIKSAKNFPSANRAGLENAGYNPMLAVQNATSGANSSWASQSSANAPDIAGGISSGIANAQSFQRLQNETAQSDSIVGMNESISRKNDADTAAQSIKNKYLDKREKAEIGKVSAETAKLNNDVSYQNAYLDYLNNQLQIESKLRMMGIDIDSQRLNDDYFLRRDFNDKMYNASTYRSWSDHFRNVGIGIGSTIHGGSTIYNDYNDYKDRKDYRNRRRVGF